jgi:hypothetical protein
VIDMSATIDITINACISMNANYVTVLCNNNLFIYKHNLAVK